MSSNIPTQNQLVAYQVIDGSAYLVCPEASLLYSLNPVATRIWELADGETSTEAIAEKLCEEFEVDIQTALRDTEAMVQAFTKKELFGESR